MKKKKKSTVGWILTWADQKKSDYMWSVILAIANVVFRIIPYFMIADVVKMFLDEEMLLVSGTPICSYAIYAAYGSTNGSTLCG